MIGSKVFVTRSRRDKDGWIPLSRKPDKKANLMFADEHEEFLRADSAMSPARDI